MLAGVVYDHYGLAEGGQDWGMIFLVSGCLLMASLCFVALFRGGDEGAKKGDCRDRKEVPWEI